MGASSSSAGKCLNRNTGANTVARVIAVRRADRGYPDSLAKHLGDRRPETLFSLGSLSLLEQTRIALFCSVRCPGNLILKTYDLARELRDAGMTVISGFHSPMEKECLSILLRGKQPVIWCQAKRLTPRSVPKESTTPLAEGRLLILSPFQEVIRRITWRTALFRNEVVAALSHRVFVPYAAPGSKTESFCRRIIERRQPLLTFDDPETAHLRELGARPIHDIDPIFWGDPQ